MRSLWRRNYDVRSRRRNDVAMPTLRQRRHSDVISIIILNQFATNSLRFPDITVGRCDAATGDTVNPATQLNWSLSMETFTLKTKLNPYCAVILAPSTPGRFCFSYAQTTAFVLRHKDLSQKTAILLHFPVVSSSLLVYVDQYCRRSLFVVELICRTWITLPLPKTSKEWVTKTWDPCRKRSTNKQNFV